MVCDVTIRDTENQRFKPGRFQVEANNRDCQAAQRNSDRNSVSPP
jgi:hypothetical protein